MRAYLPDFEVDATATSGLTVSLTASGPCTLSSAYAPSAVHGTGGGPCTITATQAGDDNYNAAAAVSRTFYIFWPFTGFFQPVDNPPTVNVVNAGRAIPVKFSLSGDKGLNIFAVGFPVSQQIACSDGSPVSEIEQTVTAGGSSLSYDAESDTYTYVWKTEEQWAATCRQLIVRLNDGSERVAFFKFK